MAYTQGLKPGALLRHSTYRIEKVLGQGGFGITYLAVDLNLERKVAIKEFFPKDYCDRNDTTSHVTLGTQSTTDFVNRLKAKFLKEARNIAKFDNPGIIKIHAAFEENNTAYYVMDYIEGCSLSELIKREGPLSESVAYRYIQGIGKALQYVHERKINHLDIKPANIMIRKADNQPVLIDFGLSKQYDSSGNQTSTTPTGISHGYAPMEQYSEGGVKEFSPQTDLYSLAATLYYILTGVVPPQAVKLVDEELPFPETFPEELKAPIIRAMSPGRKRRHETVGDFLNELEVIIQPSSSIEEETTIITNNDGTEALEDSKSVLEISGDATGNEYHDSDRRKTKKWIWGLVIGIVVVIGTLICVGTFVKTESPDLESEDFSGVKTATIVKEMEWDSPLGKAIYSGEIQKDTVEGSKKLIPNGRGRAEISEGEFKGSVYRGEFVMGTMEGQSHYTLSNGDTFEGTFTNNNYGKGKYTVKKTGEYFEGSFKNGEPDKGNWYTKSGKKL